MLVIWGRGEMKTLASEATSYHRLTGMVTHRWTRTEGQRVPHVLDLDVYLERRTTAVREIPRERPPQRLMYTAGRGDHELKLQEGALGREG